MERRGKKAFGSIAVFFALAFWSLDGFAYTLLDGNFELKGFVRDITAVRTDDPHVGKGLGGENFEKGDVTLSRSFLHLFDVVGV